LAFPPVQFPYLEPLNFDEKTSMISIYKVGEKQGVRRVTWSFTHPGIFLDCPLRDIP
jgi:hypothetical protein